MKFGTFVRYRLPAVLVVLWIGLLVVSGGLATWISTGVPFLPWLYFIWHVRSNLIEPTKDRKAWTIWSILCVGMASTVAVVVMGAKASWQGNTMVVSDEVWQQGFVVFFACATSYLIGGILLFRGTHRTLERFLPGSLANVEYLYATWTAWNISMSTLVLYVALRGWSPILFAAVYSGRNADTSTLAEIVLASVALSWWLATVGVAAVALRRAIEWRVLRRRLGVTSLGWKDSVLAIAIGVVLAIGSVVVLPIFQRGVWTFLGWPTTPNNDVLPVLWITATLSVIGACSEELCWRGWLQPRLGIVVSALVFASFHAPQYATDGFVWAFVCGCILGVTRLRCNTTASMLVHATYNLSVVCFLAYAR